MSDADLITIENFVVGVQSKVAAIRNAIRPDGVEALSDSDLKAHVMMGIGALGEVLADYLDQLPDSLRAGAYAETIELLAPVTSNKELH